MKIIALDIGNVHTGVARADELGIIATPYKSVATHTLKTWLTAFLKEEAIEIVVVGLPTTLRGTQSDQTKTVIALKEELEREHPQIKWVLFDERFTSKEAQKIMRINAKKTPGSEHAIAAAIILQTYLESLHMQQNI